MSRLPRLKDPYPMVGKVMARFTPEFEHRDKMTAGLPSRWAVADNKNNESMQMVGLLLMKIGLRYDGDIGAFVGSRINTTHKQDKKIKAAAAFDGEGDVASGIPFDLDRMGVDEEDIQATLLHNSMPFDSEEVEANGGGLLKNMTGIEVLYTPTFRNRIMARSFEEDESLDPLVCLEFRMLNQYLKQFQGAPDNLKNLHELQVWVLDNHKAKAGQTRTMQVACDLACAEEIMAMKPWRIFNKKDVDAMVDIIFTLAIEDLMVELINCKWSAKTPAQVNRIMDCMDALFALCTLTSLHWPMVEAHIRCVDAIKSADSLGQIETRLYVEQLQILFSGWLLWYSNIRDLGIHSITASYLSPKSSREMRRNGASSGNTEIQLKGKPKLLLKSPCCELPNYLTDAVRYTTKNKVVPLSRSGYEFRTRVTAAAAIIGQYAMTRMAAVATPNSDLANSIGAINECCTAMSILQRAIQCITINGMMTSYVSQASQYALQLNLMADGKKYDPFGSDDEAKADRDSNTNALRHTENRLHDAVRGTFEGPLDVSVAAITHAFENLDNEYLKAAEDMGDVSALTAQLKDRLSALATITAGNFDAEKFQALSAEVMALKAKIDEGADTSAIERFLGSTLNELQKCVQTDHPRPFFADGNKEYDELLDDASNTISELREALDAKVAESRALALQVETLTQVVNDTPAPTTAATETAAATPTMLKMMVDGAKALTVAEVLEVLQAQLGDRLVIMDSAWASAKGSTYENTAKLMTEVTRLCTDYLDTLNDGGNTDTARKCFSTSVFRSGESQTVLADATMRSQREHRYNGEVVLFQKHLALGNAQSPAKHARIYFERIDGKIVLAYCGEHLKTTQTS